MSNMWAYYNKGNNHYQTLPSWGMACPDDPYFQGMYADHTAFFQTVGHHTHGANVVREPAIKIIPPENHGRYFIGFDGKRWQFGFGGLPSSFLDPDKYPAHIYSYEGISKASGRPTQWLHGYISKDSAFPEQLPALSKTRVRTH
jgi:hypothetical protein